MTPYWSLAADGLMALLLIMTIVTVVRLEGALRVVRRDRGVFETLISNLSSATESVKIGIQALRDEAARAARHIEQCSQDADKMATDLSFLIEAADRAGTRLEERLRSARPSVVVRAPESKSVRIARKLRTSQLIPKHHHGEASTETLIPEPAPGPKPSVPPILAEVPIAATGQGSRSGGLFGQAGITTRGRSHVVVAAVSEIAIDPNMSGASQDVTSAKKIG